MGGIVHENRQCQVPAAQKNQSWYPREYTGVPPHGKQTSGNHEPSRENATKTMKIRRLVEFFDFFGRQNVSDLHRPQITQQSVRAQGLALDSVALAREL